MKRKKNRAGRKNSAQSRGKPPPLTTPVADSEPPQRHDPPPVSGGRIHRGEFTFIHAIMFVSMLLTGTELLMIKWIELMKKVDGIELPHPSPQEVPEFLDSHPKEKPQQNNKSRSPFRRREMFWLVHDSPHGIIDFCPPMC